MHAIFDVLISVLSIKVLRMLSEKRSIFSERRDQSGPSCSKGGNRYPPDKSVSTVDNAM